MTHLPDDQLDPYESRLARRVEAFSEQAVRPIDATAIAAQARAAADRRSLRARLFGGTSGTGGSTARFGLLLIGAVVVAGALGVYVGGGGKLGPVETPVVTFPASTSATGGTGPCAASALTGEITEWQGAAGHRIAVARLHNTGTSDCRLPEVLQATLIDADGRSLIVGDPVNDGTSIDFRAGATATTSVDMSNYCGPDPTGPLKLRFSLPDQTSFDLAIASGVRGSADPPPCNGPTQPARIKMTPIQP